MEDVCPDEEIPDHVIPNPSPASRPAPPPLLCASTPDARFNAPNRPWHYNSTHYGNTQKILGMCFAILLVTAIDGGTSTVGP